MQKSTTIGLASAALVGVLTTHFGLVGPAYTADPVSSQLAAEIVALKSRIAQLESRASATSAPAPRSAADTALASLQSDVDAIKQVLHIAPSSVTLKTSGSLVLQAGGTATLEAGGSIQIKAASGAELDAAKIELRSKGMASVRGATVSLNNGSRPVAFQGAKTAGNQSSQLITEGSATILVP